MGGERAAHGWTGVVDGFLVGTLDALLVERNVLFRMPSWRSLLVPIGEAPDTTGMRSVA